MNKTMKCNQCSQEIDYNYHFECYECNCGKTYNAVGNELAPRRQWQDEFMEEDY
jgi:hypothetical protein